MKDESFARWVNQWLWPLPYTGLNVNQWTDLPFAVQWEYKENHSQARRRLIHSEWSSLCLPVSVSYPSLRHVGRKRRVWFLVFWSTRKSRLHFNFNMHFQSICLCPSLLSDSAYVTWSCNMYSDSHVIDWYRCAVEHVNFVSISCQTCCSHASCLHFNGASEHIVANSHIRFALPNLDLWFPSALAMGQHFLFWNSLDMLHSN